MAEVGMCSICGTTKEIIDSINMCYQCVAKKGDEEREKILNALPPEQKVRVALCYIRENVNKFPKFFIP